MLPRRLAALLSAGNFRINVALGKAALASHLLDSVHARHALLFHFRTVSSTGVSATTGAFSDQ